jgi:DNA adenine methylase
MSRPTPPLKFHGGKHFMTRHIIQLMPPHLHYVEPYFGGGQVLFARNPADRRLWWTGRASDGSKIDGVSEVANDLHANLMNLYAVLKDPATFERLRHRLDLTLHSQQEWEAARDLLARPDGEPVARAAALFTFCRQSRSAEMECFAPTVRARLRGSRNDGVNAWWGAVDGLEAVHLRLRNVKILCRPALEVIRKEDTPATLFYCDPPYEPTTRTARKVYDHEMTTAQHRELLDALRAVKGRVMLSGYPNEMYDSALAGWSRYAFDKANHAAGGKTKGRETEVLWCNF